MAASAQITLRKKPNRLGQYPLAIRITKNRRSTYKHIGPHINIEDWDDSNKKVRVSHPDSDRLNKLIQTKVDEANKALVNLQIKNKDATAIYIKKEIYKTSTTPGFFEFAKEHLEELEILEKHNRLSSENAYVGYIQKFHKSKQLSFEEIDERFIKKLKIFLVKKHSLSPTSVMNVLVFIRLLYNKAIKDGITRKKFYPFGSGKVKIKFPETEKIGLNAEEILRLEALSDLSHNEFHSRNIWLFCFYFAGIRVSDALRIRWSDIKDGRLYYTMGKNLKLLSLKIPDKVNCILEYYQRDKRHMDDFIFPELKKADIKNSKDIFNKIKTGNKKFNEHLKSLAKKAVIEKKLTMHIARHSFGNIAGDSIHPLMLQKLYRHTDLKTTINYQSNFIHKEADDALKAVINF